MKNIIKSLPIMLALSMLFLSSCDEEDNPMTDMSYTDVMPDQIKNDLVDDASISPYAAIFDVSPNYDQGHLPFATNAGSVDGLGTMLANLDKTKNYLVYCHGDVPSIAAAELLVTNGFENVHRLKGNYGAWNDISFVDIAASKVKSKMDDGDFMATFDVSPMFSNGHLPGATNANADAGGTDLATLIAGMDKTKEYLVYCHGDAPAMAGAQLMEDAGFTNVFRLEGNYGAWVDAGYTVEMPEENTYTDVMASQIKTDLVDDANMSPYEKIFDVSPAYDQGHLPFATNVGSVTALGDMLDGLDKTKNYLVYCHGDGPSIAGAELLIDNGFENVHRLEGNYGAWDALSFIDIAASQVKSKMDASDFEAIFDVSPNYDAGHLPGATNANASAGGTDLSELIANMDKTKEYLVYCHGNAPSMAGAQLMEDAGFTNVYRLEGNYGAWVDAGYTVETPSENTYTDVMASQIKTDIVDDANISPYEKIFDVSPYFNDGHLPFATNAAGSLGDMLDGLDKTKQYLVYCHGDGPSIAGAELMANNGFTNVHRLEGNHGAWDAISFLDIPASKAKTKIEAQDFEAIFDVSPSYSSGHLPGATNANANGGGTALSTLIANMDKTKSYLVYCHGDAPAFAGAQLMEDAGFTNVYRLEGNYGAWVDAGYTVE